MASKKTYRSKVSEKQSDYFKIKDYGSYRSCDSQTAPYLHPRGNAV